MERMSFEDALQAKDSAKVGFDQGAITKAEYDAMVKRINDHTIFSGGGDLPPYDMTWLCTLG